MSIEKSLFEQIFLRYYIVNLKIVMWFDNGGDRIFLCDMAAKQKTKPKQPILPHGTDNQIKLDKDNILKMRSIYFRLRQNFSL